MQRLLNEKEVATIKGELHNNLLLNVCRQVWPGRLEEIETVKACTEDVFCEVAWIVDELADADVSTDPMSLVSGLWTTVIVDIANWGSDTVSLADRFYTASTIFSIVATALSLHWNPHYCDTLRDALLAVIDDKRPAPKDLYAHQQQERQQEEMTGAVIACSAMLNEWVNEYLDDTNRWLSDEIDLALNPHLAAVKPGKGKNDGARKTFNIDTFRETFTYKPDNMTEAERDIRLKLAFTRMQGSLIDRATHYDTFNALFSGSPLDVKIVWVGINSQLRCLFSLLLNKKLTGSKKALIMKPVGGINQILSARFIHEDGSSFTPDEIRNAGNDGDMSTVEEVVKCLTPKPTDIEDLEAQLRSLITEEQQRSEQGRKDGRNRKALPEGTNTSPTPNQHTHTSKRK